MRSLTALARVVLAILERVRDCQAKGAGRAEAVAESATHALDLIRKARDAPVPLLMQLLIQAGCATTTASVGTDVVVCSAFEPIQWSNKDTDETIRASQGT